MGHRCCTKQKVKRGLWSPEEDEKLIKHITTHGHGSWSSVPKLAGLQRCGKSCRLRWINYLRPDLKRGSFTAQEEQIIIDVHRILGNRWAQIAKHLPGRTDNEVKNFWNSCIKKKLLSHGLDPKTHNLIPSHKRAASNNNKFASNNTLQAHQQPFTVTTVNSNAPMEISPAVLTLPTPPPPPPPLLTPKITTSKHACYSQNPNVAWNGNSQTSHQESTAFPCISSIESTPISSSSSSVNPCGFGHLDENNSIWSLNNNILESFEEAPRVEVEMQPSRQEEQEKEKIEYCGAQINRIYEPKPYGLDQMDASFDSSTFDLEFMESTLLSGTMCRELSSMDDLAWNF